MKKIIVTETFECGSKKMSRTVEIEPKPERIEGETAVDLKKVARYLHDELVATEFRTELSA